jgi:hypothetical protein
MTMKNFFSAKIAPFLQRDVFASVLKGLSFDEFICRNGRKTIDLSIGFCYTYIHL